MAARGPSLREQLLDTFCTLDRRGVALGRIAVGIVLLLDLARQLPEIDIWFTDAGLFPSAFLMRRTDRVLFSLVMWASSRGEVLVCFAVAAVLYALFTIGYRTRLFHVLSMLALVSLHIRVSVVQNGGDRMFALVMMWLLFLPIGDRFSVDAVLASLRRRREATVAELEDRAAIEPDGSPVRSIGALAAMLQLLSAYVLNAIQKSAFTWKEGSAIYYVMMSERTSTAVACAVRDHLPPWAYVMMARSTLAIEYGAPALIVSPIGRPWTRRVAFALLFAFHVAIHELITVGLYSFIMVAYYPLFLAPEDFAALSRWIASKRAVTLHVDGASPLAFQLARLVARLDRFQRVTILSGPPAGVDAREGRGIVAVDEAAGAYSSGAAAIADVVSVLPLLAPFAFLFRSALGRWAFRRVMSKQRAIARWTGAYAEGDAPSSTPPRRAPRAIRRIGRLARDGSCLFLLGLHVNETLLDNDIVPDRFRRRAPWPIQALIDYPQAYQGWNMFAPGVATVSTMVFVDAVTSEGRHVDPYNELATKPKTWTGVPWDELPVCPAQDSFFDHYSRELPNKEFWLWPFRDWILRYPERTGNPRDRIVRFKVWVATDPIPDMWTKQKHGKLSWHSIFTYPTPPKDGKDARSDEHESKDDGD
ncbi:MAG TPA: HTTM domain-containing protein [Byssovorax sp.]|jgi:hypothetical protein